LGAEREEIGSGRCRGKQRVVNAPCVPAYSCGCVHAGGYVVYGMHIIRCTFRNELFLFRESLAFVPCSLEFVPCRCSSKNTYPGAQSFIVRGYLLCEQVHSEDPRKYRVPKLLTTLMRQGIRAITEAWSVASTIRYHTEWVTREAEYSAGGRTSSPRYVRNPPTIDECAPKIQRG
jgi:hypothetical protein